ncbi:MAG: Trm112 family protein [Desulfovibrio sp.]|nr:Trm112 family protein [Desulfovibrio sp.]
MDKELLAILACPRCRSSLDEVSRGTANGLLCASCALVYPIREAVPVLLPEEGIPRALWENEGDRETRPD